MADFGYNKNFSSLLPNSSPADEFDLNQSPKKPGWFSPKLQAAFIAIFAVISLVFAAGNWLNSLKVGFAVKSNINEDFLKSNFSVADSDIGKTLALQNQDTDLDGLSDYDELYVYKTSPYLPDSDSDGYADGQEVKNNEDPNCPAGQVCGLTAPAAETAVSASDLSSAEIRKMLLDQGAISEEELSKIDDATLKSTYQETLRETQSNPGAATVANGLEELKPADNAELITPEQLRALLKEQPGINSEEIDKISDAQLLEMWQEIVNEQ